MLKHLSFSNRPYTPAWTLVQIRFTSLIFLSKLLQHIVLIICFD